MRNLDFKKMSSRENDKNFLGVNLQDFRARQIRQSDSNAMEYFVGKTPLSNIPLSPDPLSYFRKPLPDQSINFDKALQREQFSKKKKEVVNLNLDPYRRQKAEVED